VSPIIDTRSGFSRFSSIIFSNALPITTPSATAAIAATSAGVEMPNPTQTGRLETDFRTAVLAESFSVGTIDESAYGLFPLITPAKI